jgi:chromosome segregation ATPase
MSERDELQKRLEAITQAQRETDDELNGQLLHEQESTRSLQQVVADLQEEVENAEMELFGLEEQLKELREAARRARTK